MDKCLCMLGLQKHKFYSKLYIVQLQHHLLLTNNLFHYKELVGMNQITEEETSFLFFIQRYYEGKELMKKGKLSYNFRCYFSSHFTVCLGVLNRKGSEGKWRGRCTVFGIWGKKKGISIFYRQKLLKESPSPPLPPIWRWTKIKRMEKNCFPSFTFLTLFWKLTKWLQNFTFIPLTSPPFTNSQTHC